MQTQTDAERKRAQRERKAKSRQKRKEQAVIAAAADEERHFEEFNQWRRTEKLVMPGEISAFQDALTISEALIVAREFLIALGQPDVQPEETLLDIERRVHFSWMKIGAPLFSRITWKFDLETGSTTDGFTYDFDRWIPLEGADLPIDITLPAIVVPAVVDVPAADTPAIVEDTAAPTSIEEVKAMEYRREMGLCKVTPQLALMIWKQQQAMDAEARKISARNEQREQEKERRLGPVAYAYEQSKQS